MRPLSPNVWLRVLGTGAVLLILVGLLADRAGSPGASATSDSPDPASGAHVKDPRGPPALEGRGLAERDGSSAANEEDLEEDSEQSVDAEELEEDSESRADDTPSTPYEIGGRIVASDGRTLSGVRVRWDPPRGADPPELGAETTSGPSGEWTLSTRVAPGAGGRLTLALAGFATGTYPNGRVAPLQGDQVFVMVPSVSLHVRVTNPLGEPVPRANVEVSSPTAESEADTRLWPRQEWEVATDGNGEAILEVSANRKLEAVIGSRGYLTERVFVRVDGTLEVILRPSAVVRLGVVDDGTGRPLAPSAELYRREPAPARFIASGECVGGNLVFDRDVDAGTYSVRLRKWGWKETSIDVLVGSGLGILDMTIRMNLHAGFECVSFAVTVEGGTVASVEGKTVHVFRRPDVGAPEAGDVDRWWAMGHSFEDVVDGHLTFGIRVGASCDLIFVEASRGLVGFIESASAREPEGVVPLRGGSPLFITPVRWGIRSRGIRELRVVSKSFGALPSWSLEARGAGYGNVSDGQPGRWIGPYPVDAVATVVCADGSSISVPVADAAK